MDSVTQFVLGAAIGEAVLKPSAPRDLPKTARFGVGAFLLGGLLGTLPDLDILARPWLNGPEALGFHRGVTHSLFFCTLASPLIALLLRRLFTSPQLSVRRWVLFVWLTLNTHWMIDSLTTYGTQVFRPFSNFPVNISSIFIIDPLYTVPLLLGTLWSLWRGRGEREVKPKGVHFGLAISTIYLCLTLASKYVVLDRFKTSLAENSITHHQLITVPSPFNSVLWFAYADTGEEVWVGDSSLLDSTERTIVWQKIPKHHDLLPHFGEGVAGQRLLWFSRGFYRLDMWEGRPIFIDLRFSRIKSFLLPIEPEGQDYMWAYALEPNSGTGPYLDFQRQRPNLSMKEYPWRVLWRRVLGQSPQ